MTRKTYKVLWSNAHASDAFPVVFTSKREAERFGAAWKREMVALEAPEARADARWEYEWEVTEVGSADDPDAVLDEGDSEEGSLDYFNRYIAGDR